MDSSEKLLARIERLIAKGITVLDTHSPNPPGVIGGPTLDPGFFAQWRNQSLALLTNLLGAGHTYVVNFESEVDVGFTDHVKAGIGILRAVHEDLRDGFLTNVRTLVSADVFTPIFLPWPSTSSTATTRTPQLPFAGPCWNRVSAG